VLGTYVLSAGYYDAYYLKGQKVRSLIARISAMRLPRWMRILTPTYPVPPFKLGERTDDPLQMYLADIYTVTGSLGGGPGDLRTLRQDRLKLPVACKSWSGFGEARCPATAHAFEAVPGSRCLSPLRVDG